MTKSLGDGILQSNQYRCALCHNVYEKAWNDDEALAETASYWPAVPQEQLTVVCDDCWEKIRPETHPQEYAASLSPTPIEVAEQKVARWRQEGKSIEEIMHLLRQELIDILQVPPFFPGDR